jgi:hypothetical protein
MAQKYLTASAAIGTSGSQTIARKIFVTGDQAVNTIGTVALSTGGSGGTVVWKCYMDGGSNGQFTLPNIVCDYVTISNVEVNIEYYKQHGV